MEERKGTFETVEREMKAYDYAELFNNTSGRRGEKELREYVANGGDINEADKDGTTAGGIAAVEKDAALTKIVEELGGEVKLPPWA
ncbi:MAG: hypothetical protein GY788_07415 [bacterium]|nr:hypothetical protein [bacterium]